MLKKTFQKSGVVPICIKEPGTTIVPGFLLQSALLGVANTNQAAQKRTFTRVTTLIILPTFRVDPVRRVRTVLDNRVLVLDQTRHPGYYPRLNILPNTNYSKVAA